MTDAQTHADVIKEIDALKQFADEALNADCWGDYMAYLDSVKMSYRLIEGEGVEVDHQNGIELQRRFKHAILKELAGLWGMARATYEKELFAFKRY